MKQNNTIHKGLFRESLKNLDKEFRESRTCILEEWEKAVLFEFIEVFGIPSEFFNRKTDISVWYKWAFPNGVFLKINTNVPSFVVKVETGTLNIKEVLKWNWVGHVNFDTLSEIKKYARHLKLELIRDGVYKNEAK